MPPRDPEAFADALCRLADDPGLRRGYGQNARALAERSFSRDRLASEFVALLADVYSKKRKQKVNAESLT